MSDEIGHLKQVLAYRDEAQALRKAAAADLEQAKAERGQVEHAKREMQALEKSIARREEALKKSGEPAFLARCADADAKLKKAEELMARYDKDKHAAMIALQKLEENERAAKAAREASALVA